MCVCVLVYVYILHVLMYVQLHVLLCTLVCASVQAYVVTLHVCKVCCRNLHFKLQPAAYWAVLELRLCLQGHRHNCSSIAALPV